jgi:hypothetical protein
LRSAAGGRRRWSQAGDLVKRVAGGGAGAGRSGTAWSYWGHGDDTDGGARVSFGRNARRSLAAVAAAVAATLLVVDLLASGPARPLGVLAVVAAYAAGALAGPARRRRGAGRHVTGRRRRAEARRDCERSLVSVRSVGRVAEQVAGGDSASFVVLDVARALVELLDLADCRYEPGDRPSGLPALRHGGELELWGIRWSPVPIGLPERGFEVEMVARGLVEGRFVCMPRRREPIPEDRLLAAIALADQAASARLIERTP